MITDYIKHTLYEGYATMNLSITDVVVCLLAALLISIYVFIIYRFVTKNAFYNRSFNISLIGMAVITAAVILTIQTSVVVSLGMVGALSIVRFRTAIKDPMDLLFLFWSISIGIICGAGFALIAIVASLIITIVVFIMNAVPDAKMKVVLLVNTSSVELEDAITAELKKYCRIYNIKARNMTKDSADYAIEILTKQQGELLSSLMKIEKVTSASIVAHDGEVTY